MKSKECPNCGQKLIKVLGSNVSCINKDCENYVRVDDEKTYIDVGCTYSRKKDVLLTTSLGTFLV